MDSQQGSRLHLVPKFEARKWSQVRITTISYFFIFFNAHIHLTHPKTCKQTQTYTQTDTQTHTDTHTPEHKNTHKYKHTQKHTHKCTHKCMHVHGD